MFTSVTFYCNMPKKYAQIVTFPCVLRTSYILYEDMSMMSYLLYPITKGNEFTLNLNLNSSLYSVCKYNYSFRVQMWVYIVWHYMFYFVLPVFTGLCSYSSSLLIDMYLKHIKSSTFIIIEYLQSIFFGKKKDTL